MRAGSSRRVPRRRLQVARHPYTRGLVASLPRLGSRAAVGRRKLQEISGVVPSIADFPPGCRFHPRCARADRYLQDDGARCHGARRETASSVAIIMAEARTIARQFEDLRGRSSIIGGTFLGGAAHASFTRSTAST